jgi:hypothetical protein
MLVEKDNGQLLAGKQMRPLSDRANYLKPTWRGDRVHLSLAVSQPIDETFQLPGNTQVIYRDGVKDNIRPHPPIPQTLEVILDHTLPFCFCASFTACAGGQAG